VLRLELLGIAEEHGEDERGCGEGQHGAVRLVQAMGSGADTSLTYILQD